MVDLSMRSLHCSGRLAQRRKPARSFGSQQRRLLPGGEVAAAVELVVVDELGKRPLGPAARRLIELVGKDADGHRDRGRS